MISVAEIRRRAANVPGGEAMVERDYLLSWVLKALYESGPLRESFVFKGGTALRKIYFLDEREATVGRVWESTLSGLLEWDRLDDYLARFGSGAVYKRLGYLVECGGLAIPEREKRLGVWHAKLKTGISALEPGAGTAGRINSRWRLRLIVKS